MGIEPRAGILDIRPYKPGSSEAPGIANLWEEVGEYAWPALGGLIMVEAVKHNAAVTPGLRTARVSRRALEGQRQPALSPGRVSTRTPRD